MPRTRILSACAAAALAIPAAAARAQSDVLDVKSATQLLHQYALDMDTVHAKMVALANAIPAEKFPWRPEKSVRSVSEVFMHVAEEWYYWGPQSLGAKPPADFGVPKDAFARLAKITGKADVLKQLDESWKYYTAQFVAADPSKMTGAYPPWKMSLDRAAIGMIDDQHEHLGQMIAYARMLGVTPPWSK